MTISLKSCNSENNETITPSEENMTVKETLVQSTSAEDKPSEATDTAATEEKSNAVKKGTKVKGKKVSKKTAKARLARLEKEIISDLKKGYEAGVALNEIREDKLYKFEGFSNFGDYCLERFRFSRQHAYRLIEYVTLPLRWVHG